MRQTLTPRTSRLLDIQGFDTVDVQELARVAPWLRLAFGRIRIGDRNSEVLGIRPEMAVKRCWGRASWSGRGLEGLLRTNEGDGFSGSIP